MFLHLVTITLVGFALTNSAVAEQWIPLVKGNYWIYRGPSKWLESNEQKDGNVAKEGVLTCRMEITEVIHRGAFTAAVLQGFPADLDWYDPNHPSGQHLIVRIGAGTYYLFSGKERVEGALANVEKTSPETGHCDWLKDEELWLDVPLIVDKRYGDPAMLLWGWHCWWVAKAETFKDRVRGLRPVKRTVYTVANRTAPSHNVLGIVQGIGLVSYECIRENGRWKIEEF